MKHEKCIICSFILLPSSFILCDFVRVELIHRGCDSLVDPCENRARCAIDRRIDQFPLLLSKAPKHILLAGDWRRWGVDAQPQPRVLVAAQCPLDVLQSVVASGTS